ncbi:ankyrin repeat family protein [Actinidia rufa]|uniref:Ankyrin repeat family protein n=1 Tax=Actinidia rufa TaxID=165716 RepID=A0A7J0EDS6_9ERIC|nr:ankyrin repeat family protein [Actinidia rufa]
MVGTLSGADFDAEVAEIRACVVNEVNELGETALFTAAERGHFDVVKELLKYANKDSISKKNLSGFDPLHIAARQGHHGIVQVLLDHDPELCKTIGPSNATPLISAASRGHTAVVNELLLKDCSLLEISRSNGKNALHLAARQGHEDIVKALLDKRSTIGEKDRQERADCFAYGCERALHVATRKKRAEIVNELLHLPDTNVNALTRDHKTALDIAEGLPLSEESSNIKDCLNRYGAVRANELNQPRDELRKTNSEKLHREGINNATNSVTVVAVLFATVAFAAIFTVPGGDLPSGKAVVANYSSFKIFFIFNAIALFTSLAVVVVQITLVRGETKTERRVVEVINKLMWLASVCTSVAFMASSYIVVGRHYEWAAILVTVVGGLIMVGVLGPMTYYVVKSKEE